MPTVIIPVLQLKYMWLRERKSSIQCLTKDSLSKLWLDPSLKSWQFVMRAHVLTHSALLTLIWNSFPLISRTWIAHESHHIFTKQTYYHCFHCLYLSVESYCNIFLLILCSTTYTNWSHIRPVLNIYISMASKFIYTLSHPSSVSILNSCLSTYLLYYLT